MMPIGTDLSCTMRTENPYSEGEILAVTLLGGKIQGRLLGIPLEYLTPF